MRKNATASVLDISAESLHSASSSQAFLLQPLKGNGNGNGNKSNNSIRTTHQEVAMDDRIRDNQLYG
jgi:hypothetical protein